jgi:hypothetical protein
MKKYALIIFIFVISIMLSVPVYAQTAKEALMGLKKLQARCQTGISYRDYGNALADAKFPVNLFMESAEAKKSQELTESINKVINHYVSAGVVWNYKISNTTLMDVNEPQGLAVKKIYPQAPIFRGGWKDYYSVDELLPYMWEKASAELETTSKLYTRVEEHTSDVVTELNNLKKENEDLKMKIADLQKENAALKEKQKKR